MERVTMHQPTFKQFLTEQEDELKTDIETVIEECSEFFQAINGDSTTYKLYRAYQAPLFAYKRNRSEQAAFQKTLQMNFTRCMIGGLKKIME